MSKRHHVARSYEKAVVVQSVSVASDSDMNQMKPKPKPMTDLDWQDRGAPEKRVPYSVAKELAGLFTSLEEGGSNEKVGK